MSPADTGGLDPLVQFIVMNHLADTLIARHVDDGSGYCRACGVGGQRGYHRHPCFIRGTAERARQIERN
jgi:hypothetical protein